MKKYQSNSKEKTWRVYMYFPFDFYFKLREEASKIGYTKAQLKSDHHVKDYIISLLDTPECLDCGERMHEDDTRGNPAYKWRCPRCGDFFCDTEIRLERKFRTGEGGIKN